MTIAALSGLLVRAGLGLMAGAFIAGFAVGFLLTSLVSAEGIKQGREPSRGSPHNPNAFGSRLAWRGVKWQSVDMRRGVRS